MNCLSTWHFCTSIKGIDDLGRAIWEIFSCRKDVGMSTCKLSSLLFVFVFLQACPSLLYSTIYLNAFLYWLLHLLRKSLTTSPSSHSTMDTDGKGSLVRGVHSPHECYIIQHAWMLYIVLDCVSQGNTWRSTSIRKEQATFMYSLDICVSYFTFRSIFTSQKGSLEAKDLFIITSQVSSQLPNEAPLVQNPLRCSLVAQYYYIKPDMKHNSREFEKVACTLNTKKGTMYIVDEQKEIMHHSVCWSWFKSMLK